MRFWDSSALVPLLVVERHTAALRGLAESDPGIVTWWGSPVECASAVHRLRREGAFDAASARTVLTALGRLTNASHQVLPGEDLRRRAIRLTSVHALRAADALQLAASLVWCRDRTADAEFVSLDERLRDAASTEGFRVLPVQRATPAYRSRQQRKP